MGGTTASALTSISADLSVSISFQVAMELVNGAEESDFQEDELVAIVLGVAILLSAARSMLTVIRSKRQSRKKQKSSERTLLDFVILLTQISGRIALSTTVQLLASAARGSQTSRAARVLALLSLSVFFVWIESSSTPSLF
tara:strand:- start:2433 stop:2855 length:423 start_codon:yes stop_codon:yes gene_type:complete